MRIYGTDMTTPGTIGELKFDHNTETLSADRTILTTDKPIQFLDANGADRNVTLPAEADSTDLVFVIVNTSDGAEENLIIRDDTPTTLITVGPGQGATVSCDGTSWKTPNAKGLYYDEINGRVGIGTTSPDSHFSILGANVPAKGIAYFDGSDHGFIGLNAPVAGQVGFFFNKNHAIQWAIGMEGTNDKLHFVEGGSIPGGAKMTIVSGGKVGIGTISPGTLFELEEESADAEETISVYHDTEATAPVITLRKADNTAAAPALVDDNAVLGRINFKGHDGSGWHTGAKIEGRIDGTPSDGTDMPTELVFATTPEASGSPTEWMALMPSGQLKMAESSDPAALADHVFFYGKDVAGAGEAFAADAAANAAQLTPHNFSLFEPDVAEAYPWSYYAENKALGIKINVDMAGMIRAVEGLTGKTFIYTQDIAKDVDLEEVYKEKWIEDYIEANTQEPEIIGDQALETVEIDVPDTTKKIGEKITGYELIEGEIKEQKENIYETKKVNKIQTKENVRFDEASGKFHSTTKPTRTQAIVAAETGFTFNPPKWLSDRLGTKK